ncbi:hypothetical protein BC826DRAFT_1102546 [Russula brevipes]|nr:hypothetical protein BC826DRAFT_1102546 [Russula brevipes]
MRLHPGAPDQVHPGGLDPPTVAVAVAVAVQPPGPQVADGGILGGATERGGGAQGAPAGADQRELQWAYDTFEGALASTTSTILYFAIAFLVLSNLWTLTLVGNREEVRRRKEERDKWIERVVTARWEKFAVGRQRDAPAPPVADSLPAVSPGVLRLP